MRSLRTVPRSGNMFRLSRRKGMASALLLSLCIGSNGCMALGGDERAFLETSPLPVNGSSGYANVTPYTGRAATNPIQQAAFNSMRQQAIIQAQGGNLEDTPADQHVLGAPTHGAPAVGLPLPTELARTT